MIQKTPLSVRYDAYLRKPRIAESDCLSVGYVLANS